MCRAVLPSEPAFWLDWNRGRIGGSRIAAAGLGIRFSVGCLWIIPMIIQAILLDPSGDLLRAQPAPQ
jgi:hypothetical protein